MFPYVGEVLMPVPPKAVESVEVADTTPLIAWRVPVSEPMVSPPLKVLSALYVLAVVVLKAVVKTPVALLYARGYVAESDVEEILLLKVDQSLEDRAPRAVAEAVGRLKVKVPPLLVIEKSVPVVEVARVRAPV